MNTETVAVPLSAVVLDWSTYPRERIDLERIEEFRELIRSAGDAPQLPPVELVPHPAMPGRYLAAEGWHRIHANAEEGLETVRAIILPSDTDVFEHAVKRAAVARLLDEHPDWSNRRIADTAGVSRPFVAEIRAGGNVAPEAGSDSEVAPPRPDYALKAMRSLIEAYRFGAVRTKLGFGSEVSTRKIRRFLERLDSNEQAAAVAALRAWRVALTDEPTWLPGGEG